MIELNEDSFNDLYGILIALPTEERLSLLNNISSPSLQLMNILFSQLFTNVNIQVIDNDDINDDFNIEDLNGEDLNDDDLNGENSS